MTDPRPIPVERPDDPRLAAYRNLKDRELKSRHGRFIAEGEFVVARLLASRHAVESVLASANKADKLAALAARRSVPVYAAPQAVLNEVVGFRFHTGVLPCGVRPASPRLEDVLTTDPAAPTLLVVCPDLNNSENLGAMIRISAAFGSAAADLTRARPGASSCRQFRSPGGDAMPSGEVKCSKCGRVHATYEDVDDGDTKFEVNDPGMRMRPTDDIHNGYEIRRPICGHVDVVNFPFDTTSISPWEE